MMTPFHSSETVYLKIFLILLFINASFIVMYFSPTIFYITATILL